MAGDDDPGPPVSSGRVANLRDGPAEGLGTGGRCAQDRTGARTPATAGPPQQGHCRYGRTTATPASGIPVTGQVINLQADQGALDHRQVTVVA